MMPNNARVPLARVHVLLAMFFWLCFDCTSVQRLFLFEVGAAWIVCVPLSWSRFEVFRVFSQKHSRAADTGCPHPPSFMGIGLPPKMLHSSNAALQGAGMHVCFTCLGRLSWKRLVGLAWVKTEVNVLINHCTYA